MEEGWREDACGELPQDEAMTNKGQREAHGARNHPSTTHPSETCLCLSHFKSAFQGRTTSEVCTLNLSRRRKRAHRVVRCWVWRHLEKLPNCQISAMF